MEGEMISLYQTIDSLLPGIQNRVVLLIGSRSGEGTSTVTRELAKVAALKLGKSVLIVDLDRSRPELKYYFNLKLEHDLEEIIKGEVPIEKAFCQIGDDSLYISPLFQQSILDPQTLDSAKSRNFWEQLRNRFDLILIDSPPATLFSDGPYIARQADGVIIVVEAERTSWPVVLSVKEQILKHGGNILGIVFNKRRYYIPRFIYRWL
jgi:protein-tyrosine kinase